MYITNNPQIATIAESCGVDRIFIDMEYIGKEERQAGLNTVKSHHTIADIVNIRSVISSSELLVRINPIHNKTNKYTSSKDEIDAVIDAGADILMLPMLKNVRQVDEFVRLVGGRAKTMLLLETAESNENIDEFLQVEGVDEAHIGLNDMHLAYRKKFMFELLTDGTVERLCGKLKAKGIPYGFGGIARLGYGMLPAEKVIMEHYRLGSTKAILSRSFCNATEMTDMVELKKLFQLETNRIRLFEESLKSCSAQDFENNRQEVCSLVSAIVNK
jgi:hypothetical protein